MDAEQVKDGGQQRWIVAGEVGQTVEGGGFDDGAGVFKVGGEDCGGAAAFSHGEREAAEGEGKIPAEFFELGLGEQAEEGLFGIGEDAGQCRGRLV